MSRLHTSFRAAAAATLLAAPGLVAGQAIEGRVVLAGWSEPVPLARVQLLDSQLTPLLAAETDRQGQFRFLELDPGIYYVQAIQGDAFSSIEGPLELEAGEPARAALTMRSALYDRALECLAGRRLSGRGVLAGVAYDPGTDTPIPGVRVRVEWRDGSGDGAATSVEADGSGRFVICDLPSSVGLTVWAETLGRRGDRVPAVRVEAGAVARLDLPVVLGSGPSLRVLEAGAAGVRTDEVATVEGRLLDAETGDPIATAEVRLLATEQRTLTDGAGRFRFTRVPPTETTFGVHRLGYAWESGSVEVAPGASMVVELRAAPQAVSLDALVVRVSTPETRMARGATQAPRVLAGDRLRRAEERAAALGDVVATFPSLSMREGRFETSDGVEYGLCVESSRAMHRYAVPEQQTTFPWCEMIAVVVDGIPTIRGGELLRSLPLWEVESVEFLPPIGALRWGERASVNGALVIWTRNRGPHRSDDR